MDAGKMSDEHFVQKVKESQRLDTCRERKDINFDKRTIK